ncbi:MAG: hypothetical protein ABR941_06040 [Thermoleophilia bacterium]
MEMALFALHAETLAIGVFFAAVIVAMIVAFTLHVRLLAGQVHRKQRERAAELAALRPQTHRANPAVSASNAAQAWPASKDEGVSARKAA